MQQEELQKQLVRIFGADTVITPVLNREDDDDESPFKIQDQEDLQPDILQEMRDKPATPLLR